MNIPLKQIKSSSSPFFDSNNFSTASKPERIVNIISKALFSLYVLSAAIIDGIVIYLSILPLKYLLVLIFASVTIALALGFFTFKKFLSKKFRYTARTACSIISAILIGLLCIVFFYLEHTIGFMSAIRASEYQTDSYIIFAKANSAFKVLDDLDNHTIAIYDDSSANYQAALKKLKQKITIKTTDYGSVITAANAFLDESTDAFLVNSSLVSVITEIISSFDTGNFRILDTIDIKTKVDRTASSIDVAKDSFNIFISGIDTYGDISTVSRSDVNMIITVNPRTHTILLTSIPRDYYVQLHGTAGLKDKLTHAGLYGINMSISTLEDLYGIKIDYYIRVNFDSTISLIDAIDGIDIMPDLTFSRYTDGIYCYYQEGVSNHLDGFCALRYARERKAYGTGDLHRIQNQQEVMMAVINKLTSSKILLAKYTDILAAMKGTLETNIPSSEIYKLVNEQLNSMPNWTIERISAEGYHIDAPTYTISDQNLFVFVPYDESITTVSDKIKSVMDAN